MTYIKPTFIESLYTTLYELQPNIEFYYLYVVRLGRSIFKTLDFNDYVEELDKLINDQIEIPLQADFVSVIHAYYNPRFIFSKRAYCRVGDSIDYKEVTRYEMMVRLEKVKDWIYDKTGELATNIRFTKTGTALT